MWKTPEEKQEWLIENADYFTVIEAKGDPRGRTRLEEKTYEDAVVAARILCLSKPGSRWMIYAVKGPTDSWIKTVSS